MANVTYKDPNTGVYKTDENLWFLADGTPITDYDSRTGAYQETDGTWYTFEGTALENFDMSLGAYQESDGIWYDTNGNEVPKGSALYNAIQAYGYDVSQNNTPESAKGKVSKNTVSTTTSTVKTAKKPSNKVLPMIAGAVAVLAIVTIIYFSVKKKK